MRVIHEYDGDDLIARHGPYQTDEMVRRQCTRIVMQGRTARVRTYRTDATPETRTTPHLVAAAVAYGVAIAALWALGWAYV